MNVMDFLKGFGASVASNNPVTMAVDTGANIADLGIAAAGYLGHKTGMLSAEQLPEPLDRKRLPGSSEWINQVSGVNDSTEATIGQLGGMFVNPGKAAAKLVGGQNAKNAPKAIQDFVWENKPLPEKYWTGKDKLPRFEISDEAAKVLAKQPPPGTFRRLEQVLEHPELFNQYPQLRKMQVKAITEEVAGPKWREARAFFNPTDGSIYINPDLPLKDLKSVLLHEVQHAIQRQEGFSRGAGELDSGHLAINILENYKNASPADKRKIRAVIKGDLGVDIEGPKARAMIAESLYRRKEGEWEARTVQERMNLTQGERDELHFLDQGGISGEPEPILWKDTWKRAFGHSDLPPLMDLKTGGLLPIKD